MKNIYYAVTFAAAVVVLVFCLFTATKMYCPAFKFKPAMVAKCTCGDVCTCCPACKNSTELCKCEVCNCCVGCSGKVKK